MLPMCATVLESETEQVLGRIAAVAPSCALIEVRLDGAPPGALDLAQILADPPRPLLVTLRPRREGGLCDLPERDRLEVLARAARLGAAWIDVEWDAVDALPELPEGVKLLVSRHPGTESGEGLEALLASTRHARADAQKLALPVADAATALRLLRLARAEPRPTLAIAMGFPGVVSRLAGPRAGAPWVYVSADPERPAAAGQLAVERLAGLWAGRAPSPATRLYGVLGRPVGHSRSPDLMNAAFAALGVDALYSWLETDDVEAVLAEAAFDPGIAGFSVTIPHKVAAARGRDVTLAPAARAVDAVNTLVRAGEGWIAHNTDVLAAERLLARALPAGLSGVPVALLGNGGAARSLARFLGHAGADVRVYARHEERGRSLAEETGVDWGGLLREVPRPGDGAAPRLILNATSVGMDPNPEDSPVSRDVFGANTIAYDLVYTPPQTRFLREAQAGGATLVNGLEHFVMQARAQLELWLGAGAVAALSDEWLARAAGAHD